jgi:hypothetical protein
LAALTGNTVYTGSDSQSAVESNEWHIVPVSVTFHHFFCTAPQSTDGATVTFTVDITTFLGSTTSTKHALLTCVVAPGSYSGISAGHVSLAAGQAIDVSVTGGSASVPTAAGGVSWALAP